MTYYNTTRQKGEQLKVAWKKTKTQDDKVMEYFYEHGKATPSEVWFHFIKHEHHGEILNAVPITSIRRSITNLTSSNLLSKTDNKREGVYGRPEYVWERRNQVIINDPDDGSWSGR